MNPAFGDAVLRLSRNVDDALAVVDKAVDAAWSDAVAEEGEAIRIDREKFRAMNTAMRTHLIMRALSQVKGDTRGIERVHIEDATRAILNSPGTQVHLPDGLRLALEQRAALIYAGDYSMTSTSIYATSLVVPGETTVGEWCITTSRIKIPSGNRPRDESGQFPKGFIERFGSAVDGASLCVRTRLPGDRFQPLGMSGTKKLKDFMIDEKIPNSMRDSVPLIITSRGIAWVIGWRIAEWAKVGDHDRECLEIKVERTE